MRSTMLATALLLGGSSVVSAQNEFNLDRSSQPEVGFFSDGKAPEPSPMVGDRFQAQFQEPPSFGTQDSTDNFVSKPNSQEPAPSTAPPSWAGPQPIVAPVTADPTTARNAKQASAATNSANQYGAGQIPGVSVWSPGGPSAPRSLLSFVQCNDNACVWSGYRQQQNYRHACGTCTCQSMQTQHFGHVCTAPGCASAGCGVRGAVGAPSLGSGCDSCNSISQVATPNAYANPGKPKSAPTFSADHEKGSVAQLWPMPSLFGTKESKPSKNSKTSQNNQDLPVTFR